MAWDGPCSLNCRALLPVSFQPNLPHPSHEEEVLRTGSYSPPSTPPTLLWSRGKKLARGLRSPGAEVLGSQDCLIWGQEPLGTSEAQGVRCRLHPLSTPGFVSH